MKMQLLLVLLCMATFMLFMYYKLCVVHPDLISGFIVLIGVAISHILNSAEDILAVLFKIDDPVKPAPLIKAPASAPGSSTEVQLAPKVA